MQLSRTLTLAIGLLLGVCAQTPAQDGATPETLRLTHETLVRATSSGNLTRVEAFIHPRALGFFRESQRLVQLRQDYGPADVLPPVLDELAGLNAVDLATEYRVVGQVGVVCLTSDLQVPRQRDQFIRSTYVYAYEGNGWRLLSWHNSNMPLE